MLEQGQSVRSPPYEEAGEEEPTCEELTTSPNPCPLVLLGGRRQRKLGMKSSLG